MSTPASMYDAIDLDETVTAARPSARRRPGVVRAVFDRHYSDARRKTKRDYSWKPGKDGKLVPKSKMRYEVRFTDTAGRQRYERFADKVEANARHDELIEQFRSGSFIEAERARVTVRSVADTYLRTLVAKPASTRSSYGAIVDVFCREFGDREVGSLVVSDINRWITDLLEGGKSITSLRKYVAVIRLMLDTAVEDRQIRTNPARGAKAPKSDRRAVAPDTRRTASEYLTPAALDALLDSDVIAAATQRLIRFQFLTGMRIGEVCELRRKDIENVTVGDREVTVVNVRRSAVETKGGLIIGSTKSGRERQVPLGDEANAVLSEALGELQKRLPRFKRATKGKASDIEDINDLLGSIAGEYLLFPTARGKQHRGSNVNRALAAANRATDVAKVTTHDLRHAWTSNALAGGMSSTVVAELLGHADATLVHRVYGHAGGIEELAAAVHRTHTKSSASTHEHTHSTHNGSTSGDFDGQAET